MKRNNTPWLGPDVAKLEKAFEEAFIKPRRRTRCFDFVAGPLPLSAFKGWPEETKANVAMVEEAV